MGNVATPNTNFFAAAAANLLLFSFNLLFCSRSHHPMPFLLQCRPLYTHVYECVSAFNNYATTRTMWFNVNLANIKSVVITDYVVHIAWSCFGWQSWRDTWKNRTKKSNFSPTPPNWERKKSSNSSKPERKEPKKYARTSIQKKVANSNTFHLIWEFDQASTHSRTYL